MIEKLLLIETFKAYNEKKTTEKSKVYQNKKKT